MRYNASICHTIQDTQKRTPMTIKRFAISSICSVALLYATNGDLMISKSIRGMGMGGAEIAAGTGVASTLANPALITTIEHRELSGSATLFLPTIKSRAPGTVYHESAADTFLIPSFAYGAKIDDHLYIGAGMWGVAGMGVDFKDAPIGSGLMKMRTNLMLMNAAAPAAWKTGSLSIGIAPVLQVGMLDIEMERRALLGGTVRSHPFEKELDANIGAAIGFTYAFDNGFKIGGVYKTPISMRYDNSEGGSDLKLQQPAEYGIGISCKTGPHTFALDYKRIEWSSADGYDRFGWRDQNILAAGYQYAIEEWELRVGYNHGRSPIDTSRLQKWQNYLNLLGFPATSVEHYTAGFTKKLGNGYTLDAAVVYSPTENESGLIYEGVIPGNINISNKHGEFSLSMQLNYKF